MNSLQVINYSELKRRKEIFHATRGELKLIVVGGEEDKKENLRKPKCNNFAERTKIRYPTLRNGLLKTVKSIKIRYIYILKSLGVVFELKYRLQHIVVPIEKSVE